MAILLSESWISSKILPLFLFFFSFSSLRVMHFHCLQKILYTVPWDNAIRKFRNTKSRYTMFYCETLKFPLQLLLFILFILSISSPFLSSLYFKSSLSCSYKVQERCTLLWTKGASYNEWDSPSIDRPSVHQNSILFYLPKKNKKISIKYSFCGQNLPQLFFHSIFFFFHRYCLLFFCFTIFLTFGFFIFDFCHFSFPIETDVIYFIFIFL